MAYSFNGSNQYLRRGDTCGVTAAPCSMAIWFRATGTISSYATPIGFGGNASAEILNVSAHHTDLKLRWYSTSGAYAQTSAGFSMNVWNHVLGVEAANDSRAIYLNGANKGTNSTNMNPWPELEATALGRGEPGQNYWPGELAWGAIWNAALTDADAAALAKGWHPTLIKPQNLVAFWPLGGLDPQDPKDGWGGYDLTAYNSPGEVDHPAGLLYPQGPRIVAPGTAPAASVVPWHLIIGSAA